MRSPAVSPSPSVSPRESPESARTASGSLIAALLAEQRPDGAWGAMDGHPASTEPTALAALGLASTRPDAVAADIDASRRAAERAVGWLDARQRRDGSWPATEQVDAPSWMTSAALLACASLGTAGTGDRERRVSAAAGWLVGEPVFRLDWRTRALFRWRQFRGDPAITELNDALIGWPWVEGTFSWVEPTSLALLGLRAAARVAPNIARSSGFADRVRSAERMLVDRVVPGGGWNYGNTRVLGQDLSPYPDTTAWALLALRGVRDVEGVDRAVTTGLDRLVALIAENRSSLARSLAALALRAHGRDDAAWRAAIAERVVTAPPRETRTRALALLALAGPAVPFGA